MKKIFCYVLATDNGTAPNYAPPCLNQPSSPAPARMNSP